MLIDRLLKIALLGSEWVLYLLVVLSVLSVATMVERFVFFWRRRDDLDALRKGLVQSLEDGDVPSAAALLDKSRAVEARVAGEALRWARAGADAITDAVDSELARVRKELERGTNLLGTLGNNAPFIGLFGTVLGVIIAFDALGEAGQNTSAMGGVMGGIAEALVATGVGLFVALPAVVAYNLIQKRIGEIETDALSLTKLIAAYARARGTSFSAVETVGASERDSGERTGAANRIDERREATASMA
jgi:biopolymer transport protein ExbB/biopolymer transport protein TolQ